MKYSESQYQLAIEHFRSGKATSIRAAADEFYVDYVTLTRKLAGGVTYKQAAESL
jgi:helix-turn-helix, Psq domain